jgi:hypothetical protein
MWIAFIWLRIRTRDWVFVNTVVNLGFHKMQGMPLSPGFSRWTLLPQFVYLSRFCPKPQSKQKEMSHVKWH